MINKKIVLIFCLIISFFACSRVWAHRADARLKFCNSNLRVIQGAVEMYNMDINPGLDHIDAESLEVLNKNGYLKKVDKPEISCEYKSIGNLAENGIIFCTYHGDNDHIVDCKYFKDYSNENYEKFSQNASDDEVAKNKERILKARENAKTNKILSDLRPFFLFFFVILVVNWFVYQVVKKVFFAKK